MRIDTTLVGFDQMSWQRGKQSFVFKGERKSSFNSLLINRKLAIYQMAFEERNGFHKVLFGVYLF